MYYILDLKLVFLKRCYSINNMAQTTAFQLNKTNIRVNSICPGLIETAISEYTFEYARQRGTISKVGRLNPLGRYGVPEGISVTITRHVNNSDVMDALEVAQIVLFLASGDNWRL